MNHVSKNSPHPKIPRAKPHPSEEDLDTRIVREHHGAILDALAIRVPGTSRLDIGDVTARGASCYTDKGSWLVDWPFLIQAIHPEYGRPAKPSELYSEEEPVAAEPMRTVYPVQPEPPKPVSEYPEDTDWACEVEEVEEKEEADWACD